MAEKFWRNSLFKVVGTSIEKSGQNEKKIFDFKIVSYE